MISQDVRVTEISHIYGSSGSTHPHPGVIETGAYDTRVRTAALFEPADRDHAGSSAEDFATGEQCRGDEQLCEEASIEIRKEELIVKAERRRTAL
jgi:hypothetical protein